jgi:LPS O-antigen subunit length determinant protein (WzzB/FepE family)
LTKEWVDKLVIAVNKYMQDQDRIEAEKSLRYLEDKMSQTNLLEMKTVLSRLIEEQTKNLMLARVSDEYVLRTLSPAKVPEEKSGPQRATICIGWTLAGCFVSAICCLLWATARRGYLGTYAAR